MSIKKYYEKYWDNNEVMHGHVNKPPKHTNKNLDYFYNHIKKYVNGNILDLGCGTGDFLNYIKSRNRNVKKITGIDIAKNAIKIAKIRYPENDFIVCSAEEVFPIPDKTVDTIFMNDVIEHLVDIETCLEECKRVLKTKGRVIIITPEYTLIKKIIISLFFWEKIFYPTNPHIRFFTRKSLRRVMSDNRFIEIYYSWGLTWFKVIPQNMYTVYEKQN
ncbi:hypothetical protein COV24_05150 [candidate division WWE3 bacterium CG10_big_fil_rev_8_21_14_0_10_32_10]|uniref:Methyltransferase type 11 domain-containing protein n=1 Tax=candidate division WWE3 bacterium CG10_big_fil_rev_8_21_14_0_10_32_10 TaxID=1975090 RepID=A0A2H0R949_UNCKA|nr:MAG: hypothetical protein COV24_05150 [candidate division WWE3 bacterium CG10_big_fil_rev_8_21_14_0_10_32_10]